MSISTAPPSASRTPAAATVSRRRQSNRGRAIAQIVAPIVVFLLVLLVWLFISYVLLEPRRRFLMPPPQDVVLVGLLNPANSGEILAALWSTTQVAIVGLLVAIVIGTIIPILMIQAQWIEWSIYPWAVVLQTIPILAIVPLIGFWFQFGFSSRVLVCVLISLFPIITNTLFGLKSSDQSHHDLFTLQHATRLQRLLKLQLPGALPAILSGWRIAAGLSVVAAFVGEFFFRQGDPGIGRLIDDYRARLQSEQLFAAVALSSILGLLVFWGFGFLGHLLVGSWHESQRSTE
ncbi:MAG: ABC transporter permease subunit [Chloroflexi bacterium]|nr:ABC transporter permease subunit [Chloroflexota bacterium]